MPALCVRLMLVVVVPPAPLLVVEGVGSGSRAHAGLITVLVWVEVPSDLRLERGLARDGVELDEHLRSWARAEQEHFDQDGTRARADLVIDGKSRHDISFFAPSRFP